MAAVNEIRSAGGVVWRDGPGGCEVAVIHRDRYDDWSLPKGKLEPGEHVLAAAVREVREETGVAALPQVRLPGSRYLTGVPGVDKSVDFWSMRAMSVPKFVPNDEVNGMRWLDVAAADAVLTYAHDRGVVSAFAALKPVTGSVVLVRHAHAGSRAKWTGDDDLRPLDGRGREQAAALAPLLSLFKPKRVYAAPLTRCIDTASPLGLPIRTDTVFAEATAARPRAVADRLRALVSEGGRIVVVSQGGVIPAALAAMKPPNTAAAATFDTPKGSAWVLNFTGDELVAADALTL